MIPCVSLAGWLGHESDHATIPGIWEIDAHHKHQSHSIEYILIKFNKYVYI